MVRRRKSCATVQPSLRDSRPLHRQPAVETAGYCRNVPLGRKNRACRRGVWSYSFRSHENAFGQGENCGVVVSGWTNEKRI
jgi:hypothetical protein